ncbi:MAG TPA: hypothetical protein VGW34_06435 [Allosphingosinicella sp.]|nr:hypothetical protein [Allosphingosinicella sp.]
MAKKFLTFDVVASDNQGDPDQPASFSLQAGDTASAPYLVGGKLVFPEGDSTFDISFELQDRTTDLDLEFLRRGDDAIWIGNDAACPPAPPGDPGNGSPDIIIGSVSATKKKLRIDNWNVDPATLSFMLRFQSKRTGKLVEYDPIIENGGGGKPSLLRPKGVFAALLGLLAIVGIGVATNRGRRKGD